MREAGRFGDRRPALVASRVRQGLLAARRSVGIVPARLREALAATIRVGLKIAAAGGPERQRRFALPLTRQVVVRRARRVLVLE